MTVYVSGHISIHDREEYAKYEAGFMEVFQKFKGSVLAVDEAPTTLDGTWSATRFVLLSFPSKDDVMAWYNSDSYQTIVKHRFAASTMDAIISAGMDAAAAQ
ncbi:MAG: DUF1330 domain-containing protein [Candidatus Phaeomarinobacter sp.]